MALVSSSIAISPGGSEMLVGFVMGSVEMNGKMPVFCLSALAFQLKLRCLDRGKKHCFSIRMTLFNQQITGQKHKNPTAGKAIPIRSPEKFCR
jgi:hypothetical protein